MTRRARGAGAANQTMSGRAQTAQTAQSAQSAPDADVAVLGGGPAGSAAALLLGRWGYRVTLLTRPAARPALAESLPPSCSKLFERLGLRETIDAAAFVRATGNTVHWGRSAPRVERFGGGALGYQVSRDAFDRLLLDEAEGAGARVMRRALVRDVVLADDIDGTSTVVFEVGGRRRTLEARWVLDCTGRAGLVARRGWRRPEPGTRTTAIMSAWERVSGWPMADPTHTVVESSEAGWGWSVPVSSVRRLVTVMVDPARTQLANGAHLATVYDAELARMPALTTLVAGARRVGRSWARDASSYAAAQAAAPGVLLVGDAASFIDPLSSYGVKKALASAWLAAVVVRSCLLEPGILGPALELFEQREREIHDGLRRRLAEVSRDAAAGHAEGFWSGRSLDEDPMGPRTPDVTALRIDPEVLVAFVSLRASESIHLAPARALKRAARATVRADRVVLEEHLVCAAFPEGIRYLRNVDLVRLVELAPHHREVPALFEAYERAAHGVALPDFLGALSVLVGKGMLALE